ncbi:MAG: HipA domain-containing protein [Syntrophobacteraceae bacterium]|nr:HipA domain-containing protein [Syntrophobacteraceae bacterium]
MPKTLDVYLRYDLVGRLVQDDHGDLTFSYADGWLENAAAVPLSQSLPLGKEIFSRKQCRGFFAGVLPEQGIRENIARIFGISAKLVERYDRKTALRALPPSDWPYTKRLHQEDFCQAPGIVPELKYQNEGGPSLKQCFDLLREASDVPVVDILALLKAVISNFLIGNHDAHGKNFSLLYSGETVLGRVTRLAPFYDLVSTVYYFELTKKMAMKIGGEYMSDHTWFSRTWRTASNNMPPVPQAGS